MYLQTMIILVSILSALMCSLRILLNYGVILVKKYTFPDFSKRLVLLRLEEGPLVVECGDESLERTKNYS